MISKTSSTPFETHRSLVALVSESVRLVRRATRGKAAARSTRKNTELQRQPVKGLAHCFGCKESCDAIGFVEKDTRASFVEAVTMLAERLGITSRKRARRKSDGSRGGKGPTKRRLSRERTCRVVVRDEPLVRNNSGWHPVSFTFPKSLCSLVGVENAWLELDKRGLAPTSGEHTLIGSTLRAFRIGTRRRFGITCATSRTSRHLAERR